MGDQTALSPTGRYQIRRRNETQRIVQRTESEAQTAGVLGAIGTPVSITGGRSGLHTPFDLLAESGSDSQDRSGNLQGALADRAFGYGGLGFLGIGWGGGSHGEATVGTGLLGTLGHGSGTGPTDAIGTGVGNR